MENQPLTKRERRAMRRAERLATEQQTKQSRKHKKVTWWILGLLLLVLLVWGVSKSDQPPAAPLSGGEIPVDQDDWIKGNPAAPVTLVEFSDFQCPACRSYKQIIQQVTETFPNDVRFVYKHFPLTTIHGNAEEAARASEAAGVQGKFWAMHDILFDKQSDWSVGSPEDDFKNYALEIGLDVGQYVLDYDSSAVKSAVQTDANLANALRLNGTPTFFLNNRQIENPASFDEFKNLIQAELKPAPPVTGDQMENVSTTTENGQQ